MMIKNYIALPIGSARKEKAHILFNRNNYQQVNINNNIFNSYIIPQRKQTYLFSFRTMNNKI